MADSTDPQQLACACMQRWLISGLANEVILSSMMSWISRLIRLDGVRNPRILLGQEPKTTTAGGIFINAKGRDDMSEVIRSLDDAMKVLIGDYNTLNQPDVEELTGEPTPLEFMRYVAKNRPFVVRGGVSHWNATTRWNAEYLSKAMGSQPVKIAITPHGCVHPASKS